MGRPHAHNHGGSSFVECGACSLLKQRVELQVPNWSWPGLWHIGLCGQGCSCETGSCWWVSLHFCWRGDGGLELQTCSDALLKNLCKVNWVPIFHAGLCVTGFTCTLVTWDEACGGGAGVCLLTGQLRSGKEHSSVKASTVLRGGEKFGLLP